MVYHSGQGHKFAFLFPLESMGCLGSGLSCGICPAVWHYFSTRLAPTGGEGGWGGVAIHFSLKTLIFTN